MKGREAAGGGAAVIVLDGLGLDPRKEWAIVEGTWRELPEGLKDRLLGAGGGDEPCARAALAPTSHGVARILASRRDADWLETLRAIRGRRMEAARAFRYASWSVHTPHLFSLRQENPTWITRAAGVFAGHEEMTPEIMGNSDTGHQQIFNLMVAKQAATSTTEMIDDGRFFRIEELRSYDAEGCLSWILGRQFMERDYKGDLIRREYELLTANRGRGVSSIEEAFELVRRDHEADRNDAEVEPIVIGRSRTAGENTVLFNGIFRADRQEPITAALLDCKRFIRRQASQKKRLPTWGDLRWLRPFRSLRLWSMIDYHEDLTARGLRCAWKVRPHEHNVLHLLTRTLGEAFRFLFLTEGVKEKHMGLFSRGLRSGGLEPSETQRILKSHGKDEGVGSDNDLYKVPRMRHPEIAAALAGELRARRYDLIAANFPGADMIGHLIADHFDACVETLTTLDRALAEVVPAARENGRFLVIASDHGNVEHDGPDHGNNGVLTTTVIPGSRDLVPVPPEARSARLFDVAWTLLAAMGLEPGDLDAPPFPEEIAEDPRRLVGAPLVRPAARRG